MVRAIRRGWAPLLGVALLSSVSAGCIEPAAAARGAPLRPQELSAPLFVGAGVAAVPNPPRNVAPQPDYRQTCVSAGWRNAGCKREVLAAIRHARELEGVARPSMVLPHNYDRLNVAEQTFVVTDLERTARGLKPFAGLTSTLNATSHAAAAAGVDPEPVISLLHTLGVSEYGSNWAADFGPLSSDYDWMYNDGYSSNGINLACPTPTSSGCWGHRENILGSYQNLPTLLAGAGTSRPPGASIAEVMTGGRGQAPRFTYTWRQARRHGAHNGQRR